MLEIQGFALKNTLSNLIKNCKNKNELKQIYTQIITSHFLTPNEQFFLITRFLLLCGLSNSGSLPFAIDVFRALKRPNRSVYNIMIRAVSCQKTGFYEENHKCNSFMLYKQMLFNGILPDCLTFPFVVKECAKRLSSDMGRGVHGHVVKFGLFDDLFIRNSLINMYAAFGFLICARKVFDGMFDRDLVSWNSMIIGCLRNGDSDAALGLFRRMTDKNIITWNSIITGLVQAGRPKEALELFHEMQIMSNEMIRPDKITIASVVTACSYLGAIDHGKWVHDYLKRSGLKSDVVISTALVDMYGKCGSVERAYEVFEEMTEKDTLAWTAMISVFALNGHGEAAFRLFEEMQLAGVKPNQVTFVALLSACAHSGLVEKGRWCFETMKRFYSLEPQVHHYACMVDILSRAGLFEEAEGLIRSMPMKPDVFVWGALLGGCQLHGNLDLGEKVSQYLIDLEPHNHVFYANLCDIYAKAARFDDVKRLRILMTERGIRKEAPGCSMIEINGLVFEFSVKGSPLVEMEEVIWTLDGLWNVMKINQDTLHNDVNLVDAHDLAY